LQTLGISAGVVQDIEDMIERDAQLAARQALVTSGPRVATYVLGSGSSAFVRSASPGATSAHERDGGGRPA